MKLFVARLSSSITEENLSELFSAFGEVLSSKVVMDRETGNSKGFGFIEMPNDEEANAAIAALNETELDGKNIVVKEANPPQERPRRDFNRGGGGGFSRGGGDRRERNFRSNDRREGGGGYGGRSNDRRGGGGGGFDRNREDRW